MYDKTQKRGNLTRVQAQDSLAASDIQSNDLPQQNSNPNQVTSSASNLTDEAIDVLSFVGFKL